jgi:type IV pilus assembly protein PilQ
MVLVTTAPARADGPVARVVGLSGQGTVRSTSSRGATTTVRVAPRSRLALRQAEGGDEQPGPQRGPGLPWLIKQPKPDAGDVPRPESEDLPPPDNSLRIPLTEPDDTGEVEVTGHGDLVSIVARDASLNSVLTVLAEQTGLNILLTDATNAQITITLKDVPLKDALDGVLAITGNTWTRRNNIVFVTNISNAGSISTGVQGTVMRVFQLDYASAADVAEAVSALLSPMGRSFINQMDKADNHKTKEMVVVEDMPHVVRQIESYVRQIDTPPRQVLIEAHILQIDLKRTDLHGVNLNRIFSLLGHQLQIQTLGFADAGATQALLGSFNGNEMGALIECLQSVTDAKTLAKPKVLCLNGQEASFQVGQKLGYRIISTSQTSTLQSINFLNVGVILKVTPRISHDDLIIMNVKPEVSTGSVDQTSGLPSSNTTTVANDVLLPNGCGIVIGGLIQESDTANINKIPLLGDIWLIGRLFQRRNIVRERSEVVIFLVPRIVPYSPEYQCLAESEGARTDIPLLGEQFARERRPGEPALYDAVENPRPLRLRGQPQAAAPPSRPVLSRMAAFFPTKSKSADGNAANVVVEQQKVPEVARNPNPPPLRPMPPRNPPVLASRGLPPRGPAPPQMNLPPPLLQGNPRWANNPNTGTLYR